MTIGFCVMSLTIVAFTLAAQGYAIYRMERRVEALERLFEDWTSVIYPDGDEPF